MSTSQRTFDQVKSILGKLDQRIDALRERRNTDPVIAAVPVTPIMPVLPMPMKQPEPVAPPPPRTAYGRATPLRSA
ncbi:MAG: hypothetical protein ACREJO_04330 [Phycisphaerales bacterium]